MKASALKKTLSRERKNKAQAGRKYFQKTYLIKDCYPKYTKNSTIRIKDCYPKYTKNSTIRSQTTWLKNGSNTLADTSPRKIYTWQVST